MLSLLYISNMPPRRMTKQQNVSAETVNSDNATNGDSTRTNISSPLPSPLTTRDPPLRATLSRMTSPTLSLSSSSTDSVPLASKRQPIKRKRKNSNDISTVDMEERDRELEASLSSKKLSPPANLSMTTSKQESTQMPAPVPLSAYSCPICFSPPANATLTPCGHICCGECLFTAVRTTLQRAYTHMTPEPPLPR